ncbi:hypothetical protein [Erwinia sp. E_sp_B04_7]|uniref:hypothetical protein n=1 Tax=unclassified Erwinia TaxID=2622719 RepID=UPI0030D1ACA3
MVSFLSNKFLFIVTLLAALLNFSNSCAATRLISFHPESPRKTLHENAVMQGIRDAEYLSNQSFHLLIDGENIGTLSAGQGTSENDVNVCFISWKPLKSARYTLIPTIGFEQWEATACSATKAVRVISSPAEAEIKIAVLYAVTSPNAVAAESVILTLDSQQKLSIDGPLTDSIGSAGASNLAQLKKLYQKQDSTRKNQVSPQQ